MGEVNRERSRRSQSRLTVFDVGATSVRILTPNANRTALTFAAINAQRFTVTPFAAAVLDEGINVPAASRPVTITEHDHADALRGDWFAIASAAGQRVAVLETIVLNEPDVQRLQPGSV